jgi:hypothetical protein
MAVVVVPLSDVVLPEIEVVVGATEVLEAPLLGVIDVLTIVERAPEIAVVDTGVDEPNMVVGTEIVALGVPGPEVAPPAIKEESAPESTAKRTPSTGIGTPDFVGVATTVTTMRAVLVVLPARPVTSIDLRPSFTPEPTRTVTHVEPPRTGFDFVDNETPDGTDFTDNPIAPVNPAFRRIVRTNAPAEPLPTVIDPARTESENLATDEITGVFFDAACAEFGEESITASNPKEAVLSNKAPVDDNLGTPVATQDPTNFGSRTLLLHKCILGFNLMAGKKSTYRLYLAENSSKLPP